MTNGAEISREQILSTERLIRPHIRRTPILEANTADFGFGSSEIVLKLELCQHAGSFKTRGAFANLLLRDIPACGVVAASGGNHGVAVAFAAKKLGIPARIFVPSVASSVKIRKIESYGADLVVTGDRYADALAASEEGARESGALTIHAYDQIETLLGQATLGLELDLQAPDLDTIFIAVGGGGLVGGVAAYYRERIAASSVRIIGVEPAAAPTLANALKAGYPIDSPAGGIAADSLAPRRVGELMFPIARQCVEQVILVSDEAIVEAQKALWKGVRIAAEPGGAAAFAALLSGQYVAAADERLGVIVCGGNTSAVEFESVSVP